MRSPFAFALLCLLLLSLLRSVLSIRVSAKRGQRCGDCKCARTCVCIRGVRCVCGVRLRKTWSQCVLDKSRWTNRTGQIEVDKLHWTNGAG